MVDAVSINNYDRTKTPSNYAQSCAMNDDEFCQNKYGDKSCCMYIEVLDINATPSKSQQDLIDSFSLLGYPVKQGGNGYFCQDTLNLRSLIAGNLDNTFRYETVPITYKAFCSGA